jgi:hypothetical protein
MSRAMQIEWPRLGVAVTAVLDDANAELADAVWQHLPMSAVQEHAVISGGAFYCWLPMVCTVPAPVPSNLQLPEGTVLYSQATGNKLIIRYGRVTEDSGHPVLGQVVPEDIDKLHRVGEFLWTNQIDRQEIIEVRFSRKAS